MSDLTNIVNSALNRNRKDTLKKVESNFYTYLKKTNTSLHADPELLDIDYLFKLYDNLYFDGELSKNFNIIIRCSNKLTRSAGMVNFSKRRSEAKISLSLALIFKSYQNNAQGFLVNGIFCNNPVEALMRVLEHEIVHLIEYVLYGKSNCNDPQFFKIAFDLFGHTENKHMLGIELKNYIDIKDLKKGDIVSFPYHGKIHTGSIINIKKNVTVAVDTLYDTKKYYISPDVIIKDNVK